MPRERSSTRAGYTRESVWLIASIVERSARTANVRTSPGPIVTFLSGVVIEAIVSEGPSVREVSYSTRET